MWRWSGIFRCIVVFCVIAVTLSAVAVQAEEKKPAETTITNDKLRLGERIYREGILPSGKPVKAIVKGDIEVEGKMFTCQNCHMRSGLGSVEGGVYSPPTNGASLFKPFKLTYRGIVLEKVPPRRPAYSDASLAEMLRYGDDPTGRILNDVMPRYELDDNDMAILISYLKSLSAPLSPGYSDNTLHLATVITDDVKAEDREAMLRQLDYFVKSKNDLAGYFNPRAVLRAQRMGVAAASMLGSEEVTLLKLSLSRWILKGPPETWRAQLEDYYRKEPVFALIGGITTGEWGPVHRFCEDNRIPCLFPNTDYPVISKTDWYNLYMSKGFYQEGEGAARYLSTRKDSLKGGKVIQIVRGGREGKAMATGFRETWTGLGNGTPDEVIIDGDKGITEKMLKRLLAEKKPAAILIWDDARSLPALDMLAKIKGRPEMVFVSSSYLGNEMRTISESARDLTYITYPVSLPPEPVNPKAFQSMQKKIFKPDSTKTDGQIYAVYKVLSMALMNMRGNYYRDYFLDLIDCGMDQDVPLYERISFGPGQRYASKGCYIVQLSKGEKPELIKKSDWVIH
ncbi:MAG TPA: amino acid ABC transporter substrate-binding protein [Geobacteraceae bacterium]|nr:amino acid ABC transporter substrate-binding protein [Geobacteraceae bacterium]